MSPAIFSLQAVEQTVDFRIVKSLHHMFANHELDLKDYRAVCHFLFSAQSLMVLKAVDSSELVAQTREINLKLRKEMQQLVDDKK